MKNKDTQKIISRISKLCKDNIKAFEKYDPKYPSGAKMKGAKSESYGVIDMAKEILNEIKDIKKEERKPNKKCNNIAFTVAVETCNYLGCKWSVVLSAWKIKNQNSIDYRGQNIEKILNKYDFCEMQEGRWFLDLKSEQECVKFGKKLKKDMLKLGCKYDDSGFNGEMVREIST